MPILVLALGALLAIALSRKPAPKVPASLPTPIPRFHVRAVTRAGDTEFRATNNLADAESDLGTLVATLTAQGEVGATAYLFDQAEGRTVRSVTIPQGSV